jgi:hypothetical protein
VGLACDAGVSPGSLGSVVSAADSPRGFLGPGFSPDLARRFSFTSSPDAAAVSGVAVASGATVGVAVGVAWDSVRGVAVGATVAAGAAVAAGVASAVAAGEAEGFSPRFGRPGFSGRRSPGFRFSASRRARRSAGVSFPSAGAVAGVASAVGVGLACAAADGVAVARGVAVGVAVTAASGVTVGVGVLSARSC